MSIFGTAKVKNGQYKIKGDFHTITPNQPIRDEDNGFRLAGVTNPREVIHLHSYGGEAVFFENLCQGKLMASKCENPDCEFTGTVYQPFRIHCPDCLGKNTIIDMTALANETAKIHTFMVCERSGAFNTLDKPIRFINVEFDGVSTILMGYLLLGEPDIGIRVRPIFKTQDYTYTITDLAWVPDGTKAEDLPHGFSFGG